MKVLVCSWNLGSSWSPETVSRFCKSSLSGVGRSKTKHFRLGKNCLMHSLGRLDACCLGWSPRVRRDTEQQEYLRAEADGGGPGLRASGCTRRPLHRNMQHFMHVKLVLGGSLGEVIQEMSAAVEKVVAELHRPERGLSTL